MLIDDKQAREKMGPTPRTDALGDQPMTIGDITPPFPVLAKWESLARQLEREVESLSAQVAAMSEAHTRKREEWELLCAEQRQRAVAAEAQVAELREQCAKVAEAGAGESQAAKLVNCEITARNIAARIRALNFDAAKESGVSP